MTGAVSRSQRGGNGESNEVEVREANARTFEVYGYAFLARKRS